MLEEEKKTDQQPFTLVSEILGPCNRHLEQWLIRGLSGAHCDPKIYLDRFGETPEDTFRDNF